MGRRESARWRIIRAAGRDAEFCFSRCYIQFVPPVADYLCFRGVLFYAKRTGFLIGSMLLTEDSRSGFQFYQSLYSGTSVTCETADSNSGIFTWLLNHHEQEVFVIADGAAFGSEMDRVMKLQHQFPDKITLCLPECFEWLIL